jgi:hypothetical protein
MMMSCERVVFALTSVSVRRRYARVFGIEESTTT